MDKSEQFFYEHAGYSHASDETPEAGKLRGARSLAGAEDRANVEGASFQWELDDVTNEDHEGAEEPYYRLWCCVMRDVDGNVCQSLGGVDFGRDKEPWGDPYRRVVEAELAQEQYGE